MGRKKGSSTRRKQKLQLEDNKKPDSKSLAVNHFNRNFITFCNTVSLSTGSRAASNYDYAQMTSTSTGLLTKYLLCLHKSISFLLRKK